jgi:hypothetical protein
VILEVSIARNEEKKIVDFSYLVLGCVSKTRYRRMIEDFELHIYLLVYTKIW